MLTLEAKAPDQKRMWSRNKTRGGARNLPRLDGDSAQKLNINRHQERRLSAKGAVGGKVSEGVKYTKRADGTRAMQEAGPLAVTMAPGARIEMSPGVGGVMRIIGVRNGMATDEEGGMQNTGVRIETVPSVAGETRTTRPETAIHLEDPEEVVRIGTTVGAVDGMRTTGAVERAGHHRAAAPRPRATRPRRCDTV